MKKFLEHFKNYRKDRGDAVLVTTLISIPLLCVCFAFATGISLATWQKTSYISSAQAAATASLQKVGSNGYLNRGTMESFVSEYLSQTGRKGALALESGSLAAGQGSAKGETGVFNSGKCDTAMVNGVERKIPFIEVELDINRTAGESNISTYAYTSEGPTGTLKNPTGGFGKVVDGQQYRVINAKVWEASTNVTWLPFFTPASGDMTCQPYNVDVSAILFGNNEDLSQGEQCFQPDAFPVTPAETRQVASTPTALYTSPLGTCKTVLTSMSKGLPVLVTGTYREWSKVTTKMGSPSKAYEGWVLTASLTEPQDWAVEYDLGCDSGGCGTPTSELQTTYKSSPELQPIPSLTKPGYNFVGWQRVKCVERDNIGSVENPGAIPAYMYGKLCYVGKFSVKTYLVTWDKNGGTSGGVAAKEYPAGSTAEAPANAVKTGYNSLGWYSSPTNQVGFVPPGTYVAVTNKDLIYYQQYSKATYSISLDQNSGTGATISKNSYQINETAAQSFTLTAPTRKGYAFKSWSVSSGPGSVNGNILTIPANNAGNVIVKANYNAIDYFIILDANGGNGEAATPGNYNIKTTAQTVTLTAQRIGYQLDGWTITGNSSVASTVSGNTLTIPSGASGDIRVQANWKMKEYNVFLDKDGGSGGGDNFIYNMMDSSRIYVIAQPSKAGYSFVKWDIVSGPASNAGNYSVTVPANTGGDIYLKAVWVETYRITLQANGGTPQNTMFYSLSSSAQSVSLPTSTRAGYTFNGWYINGTNNGSFITNKTTLNIPANAKGNLLLTPDWKANSYTIYNLATGGMGQATDPFTYNTSNSVTTAALTRPWRTGYTFDGWYIGGQTQGVQSYITGDTLYIPSSAYGNIYVGAKWR